MHRDLKPENLFLARRPDGAALIKVLDFGISKILKEGDNSLVMTNPAAVVGSPFYMSPERMLSARDVDHRTDIWALGIISHELLSGRPPFTRTPLPGVCAKVLNEAHPPIRSTVPTLPASFERVLDRCLAKDRFLRFQSVAELARELAPFGSESARLSAERIGRVLKEPTALESLSQVVSLGSAQTIEQKPGSVPLGFASATGITAPSGSGKQPETDPSALTRKAIAPTLQATAPGIASSYPGLVPKQRSNVPSFAFGGLALLTALLLLVWWAASRGGTTESPLDEAPPVVVTRPNNLPSQSLRFNRSRRRGWRLRKISL